MSDHVSSLLNAYFDGELSSENIHRVEEHLLGCSQCQAELENIRLLSRLLCQVPQPAALSSTDQFIARLEQQLPVRKIPASQRILRLAWELFPGWLAVSWGFVQALFLTAFIFSAGLYSGLLPGISAVLPFSSESLQSVLVNPPVLSGWNDLVSFVLQLLTADDILLQGVTVYVVLQVVIGILFLAWMASWYVSKSRSSLHIQMER